MVEQHTELTIDPKQHGKSKSRCQKPEQQHTELNPEQNRSGNLEQSRRN